MKLALIICVCFVAYSYAADKKLIPLAEELGATTFISYARRAGLEVTLDSDGPLTVFAPTNAAFDALPADVKAELEKDMMLLQNVLSFHIISEAAYSTQLTNDMRIPTIDSELKLRVNIYQKDGTNIVTVDGAKVVTANQNATNGVIHVIDKVMYPLPAKNIPTALAKNPQFGTLVYVASQAQLVGPLEGAGPFTLFAPNNAAFDKLPANFLSDLLSNQTALVAVVKYHVVQATAYSAGLSSGSVQTLQGGSVNVTVNSDGVTVNDAKVVMADIPAENGVIHEIDTVLLPPK